MWKVHTISRIVSVWVCFLITPTMPKGYIEFKLHNFWGMIHHYEVRAQTCVFFLYFHCFFYLASFILMIHSLLKLICFVLWNNWSNLVYNCLRFSSREKVSTGAKFTEPWPVWKVSAKIKSWRPWRQSITVSKRCNVAWLSQQLTRTALSDFCREKQIEGETFLGFFANNWLQVLIVLDSPVQFFKQFSNTFLIAVWY